MLRILQIIFFGHFHIWEEVSRRECENNDTGGKWTSVYCRCKKCGAPKYFD